MPNLRQPAFIRSSYSCGESRLVSSYSIVDCFVGEVTAELSAVRKSVDDDHGGSITSKVVGRRYERLTHRKELREATGGPLGRRLQKPCLQCRLRAAVAGDDRRPHVISPTANPIPRADTPAGSTASTSARPFAPRTTAAQGAAASSRSEQNQTQLAGEIAPVDRQRGEKPRPIQYPRHERGPRVAWLEAVGLETARQCSVLDRIGPAPFSQAAAASAVPPQSRRPSPGCGKSSWRRNRPSLAPESRRGDNLPMLRRPRARPARSARTSTGIASASYPAGSASFARWHSGRRAPQARANPPRSRGAPPIEEPAPRPPERTPAPSAAGLPSPSQIADSNPGLRGTASAI